MLSCRGIGRCYQHMGRLQSRGVGSVIKLGRGDAVSSDCSINKNELLSTSMITKRAMMSTTAATTTTMTTTTSYRCPSSRPGKRLLSTTSHHSSQPKSVDSDHKCAEGPLAQYVQRVEEGLLEVSATT